MTIPNLFGLIRKLSVVLLPPHLFSFGSSFPSILGHPYWIARSSLKFEIARLCSNSSYLMVLDVGCGSMPYRSLFTIIADYHGLEIDQPRNQDNPYVTHWYDGLTFPQPDEVYDLVICSQVLEHTIDPETFLSEIFRVLRPGGQLILTIPFFWPEHEQPYDYQRFTSFGLLNRLEEAGFKKITIVKTNPGVSCIMQLSIEWLESIGRRLPNILYKPWRLFMAIPYTFMNFIGFLYRNLPHVKSGFSSTDLFLDLVFCAYRE